MNDKPPESQPVPPPDPDASATQALPTQQAPDGEAAPAPAKQRLWDRLWSFRALIAVALASVILGGLGGAALANVAQDDDERRFPGQGRFDRGGPDGPPGTMQDRRRERMQEWREDMRQRRWGQDGPPGVPPSGVPTPPAPTATS